MIAGIDSKYDKDSKYYFRDNSFIEVKSQEYWLEKKSIEILPNIMIKFLTVWRPSLWKWIYIGRDRYSDTWKL